MNLISYGNQHYIASSLWWNSQAQVALFWKIIALNRPAAIVKLVSDVCGIYWPTELGECLENSDSTMPKVKCVSKTVLADSLTVRIIEVATPSDAFRITHINFAGWPDMGVPKMDPFKKMMEAVNSQCKETTPEKRIFVHCLGGMGRTGTFISAHIGMHTPVEQRAANFSITLLWICASSGQEQWLKSLNSIYSCISF